MISLNFTAILLATLAAFILGWLWYSPIMFQKPWMRMANIPDMTASGSQMGVTMLLGFLSYVVIAGTMDTLFQIIGVGSMMVALKMALLFWFGFAATLSLGMVTWEGKPWKLYFLTNGYTLLAFLLMASILFSIGY